MPPMLAIELAHARQKLTWQDLLPPPRSIWWLDPAASVVGPTCRAHGFDDPTHARTPAAATALAAIDPARRTEREEEGPSWFESRLVIILVSFSFFFVFFFYFSWHKVIWLIVSCNKFFSSYILTCNFCVFMKKNEEGTSSELGDAPLAAPPDVARGSTRTLISDV